VTARELALLRRLLARPCWSAATALAGAGWPLQIAALALAPRTVVQPALALGLALLLVLGPRLLGEPAVLAIVLGVVAVAPRLTRGGFLRFALVVAAGRDYAAAGVTSKLHADDVELGPVGSVAPLGGPTGAVAGEQWTRPVLIIIGPALVVGGSLARGAARAVSGLLAESHV
jgi:hypothetical protein